MWIGEEGGGGGRFIRKGGVLEIYTKTCFSLNYVEQKQGFFFDATPLYS